MIEETVLLQGTVISLSDTVEVKEQIQPHTRGWSRKLELKEAARLNRK